MFCILIATPPPDDDEDAAAVEDEAAGVLVLAPLLVELLVGAPAAGRGEGHDRAQGKQDSSHVHHDASSGRSFLADLHDEREVVRERAAIQRTPRPGRAQRSREDVVDAAGRPRA